MIRKKEALKKQINRRIDEMNCQISNEKPSIAFIGKLPNGGYEVTERFQGKNLQGVACTLKIVDKIINSKEEYFASKPDWMVICSDKPMEEMLKELIDNYPWDIEERLRIESIGNMTDQQLDEEIRKLELKFEKQYGIKLLMTKG